VCVATLGLNAISDVREGGQNEIPRHQASQRSLPNTPFLAAPSRHRAGCRPSLFRTARHIFRALAFQAKSRPEPNAARMRAWNMTRSRCRYGREHTTREKLDGGRAWSLPGKACQSRGRKFPMSWQTGLLQPKRSADEEGPRATRYRELSSSTN
jgi:hypothetical protein